MALPSDESRVAIDLRAARAREARVKIEGSPSSSLPEAKASLKKSVILSKLGLSRRNRRTSNYSLMQRRLSE